MTAYFGQRALLRSPLQEKAVPLLALSTVMLCAGVAGVFLLRAPQAPARIEPIAVQPRTDETVDVLVPINDIEQNTPLDPSLFKRVPRRVDSVSARIVKDYETVRNQFARSFIVAGEPLHSGYLSAHAVTPGDYILDSIPKGYRAVSFHVDDTQSVDGLARPGSIVDLSWVRHLNGEVTVSILVQNAKVLVADRQIDQGWKPGMPIPGTITLLVTAEDYKKVEIGKATGKLGLALRGSAGVGLGDAGGTISSKDIGAPPAVATQNNLCKTKVRVCSKPGSCENLCMIDGNLVSETSPDIS